MSTVGDVCEACDGAGKINGEACQYCKGVGWYDVDIIDTGTPEELFEHSLDCNCMSCNWDEEY